MKGYSATLPKKDGAKPQSPHSNVCNYAPSKYFNNEYNYMTQFRKLHLTKQISSTSATSKLSSFMYALFHCTKVHIKACSEQIRNT
jgi:hypothetical protein